MNKLPNGYILKSLKTATYFWVEGACGYCVSTGDTAKNAIKNALKAIEQEKKRIQTGGFGKAVWLV